MTPIALTLSLTQGMQGRPFGAKISGVMIILIKVRPRAHLDSAHRCIHFSNLPYGLSTEVPREYEPGGSCRSYRQISTDLSDTTTSRKLAGSAS